MSNAVQVAKLIEGALAGQPDRVRSYGRLIAEHFEADGDARAGRIIRRAIGEMPPGAPATLDLSTPTP